MICVVCHEWKRTCYYCPQNVLPRNPVDHLRKMYFAQFLHRSRLQSVSLVTTPLLLFRSNVIGLSFFIWLLWPMTERLHRNCQRERVHDFFRRARRGKRHLTGFPQLAKHFKLFSLWTRTHSLDKFKCNVGTGFYAPILTHRRQFWYKKKVCQIYKVIHCGSCISIDGDYTM